MKTRLVFLAALSALGISASANAAVDTLDLTGVVANVVTGTPFTAYGNNFQPYFLTFDSPTGGPIAPVLVSQGDTVNVTVTLDQAVTLPSVSGETWLIQFFSGDFGSENSSTSGTVSFYNGGILVGTSSENCLTSTQLCTWATNAPFTGPITFDSYTDNFVVDVLATPGTITGSAIEAAIGTAVPPAIPEPATWALTILGFGLIGYFLRKRPQVRSLSVTYAID